MEQKDLSKMTPDAKKAAEDAVASKKNNKNTDNDKVENIYFWYNKLSGSWKAIFLSRRYDVFCEKIGHDLKR